MKKSARFIFGLAFCAFSSFFYTACAQSIRIPWSGYAHSPQHTADAPTASQPLNRIRWSTPVDLNPDFISGELFIHYGSPLITRSNTVIVPVKVGSTSGFGIKAILSATGATNWTQSTDYLLPPHDWTPSFSPALTPKNRLYFAGGGGTVYFCDSPDATNGPAFGQLAFYGLTNYLADTNTYLSSVFINTPITSDRYGDIFFGFEVIGSNPLGLQGGLARIAFDGRGTWITASNAAAPGSDVDKVAMNCSPTLSNDHKTLYFAVNSTASGFGYLAAVDSRTLAPLANIRLKDVVNTNQDAILDDDASSSPTIGPDGDVYYGVVENPAGYNHFRGWLLHFDSGLTQSRIPGAFGWDDTSAIVPSSLVVSYDGGSPYLLMSKYNNYVEAGGDGVNQIAVLDPRTSMIDPVTGANVMAIALSIAAPTPDPRWVDNHPGAVREWCINSAAVDTFSKSILANNEDGKMYRWDLTSNTLSQTNALTSGIGEAYTPTIVGSDGVVYAINDAILFSIGR